MYEFGRADLAGELLAARSRGLDVRLVSDPSVVQSRAMAGTMAAAGLPFRFYPLDDRVHQIDHVKLLVTDTAALVAGMNWGRASARNHDYGLEICSADLVARLADIFAQDWAIAGGEPARASDRGGPIVQTAPGEEIRSRLLEMIESAQRQIRAEVFTLTDHEVLAALARAERRGVRVRMLLDPGQDYNRPAYDLLTQVGVEVRWYPVPPGALLHAKAGLFDSRLLLGSANWSQAGLSTNHELDVETEQAASVRAFGERFDADWAAAGGWLG